MKVKIKIFRFNPNVDKNPYFDKFTVPYLKGMAVLDSLIYIQENLDSTLSFRWECRSAICGTCGITLDGKPVLACQTLINPKKNNTIEPLKNFSVEKDLIVDLTPVLEKLKRIRPYLQKGKKEIKTKAQAEASKDFRKCIECGCCIAFSQVVERYPQILDPMALVKLARFKTDPRDDLPREKIAQAEGIKNYSHQEAKRLKKSCPLQINIEKAIRVLKK